MSDQGIIDQETMPEPRVDRGEAPDVRTFYGRTNEMTTLERWIVVDGYRLITILGLGGIGKTWLVTRLAEALKHDFEYVIWRSLRNTPPIEDIVEDCIQFIGNQHLRELPPRVDDQIDLLLAYLKQHRCLLVLDNAEALLRKGDRAYDQAYEGYGKLFHKIGTVEHRSCLVLTSREEPREFARLTGTDEATLVRSLTLSGLGQQDARRILEDKGLTGDDDVFMRLVENYSGNPLALKMVAEPIKQLYAGDITRFLADADSVSRDVRTLLGQQFERLTEVEKDAMYWLGIMRVAVPLSDLQDYMSIGPELEEALDSLQRRAFVEERDTLYGLQDVVIDYMTEQLVGQVSNEIENLAPRLLNSHALVVAQAQEYVRVGQVQHILTPIAERVQTTWGPKPALDRVFTQLLSMLREQPKPEQRYAAGNLLGLLGHLNRGYLHGYDFSGLAVWQADLRNIKLHEVNFSGADLRKCLFKEVFGIIPSVAFSPDGKLLAAGTSDGQVRLWEVSGWKQLFVCTGHTDWVRSVAFSPDGRLLASSSEDKTVRLWDVNSEECIRLLEGHTDRVMAVAFNHDGTTLASSSDDGTVRLWDANSGATIHKLLGHMNQVRSVAFSPDGSLLASGSDDKTIRLWNVQNGLCTQVLEGHPSRVMTVAFSPDGKTLASGGEDQAIWLWDIGTGHLRTTLSGHTSRVVAIAFSPDGRTLASAGEDQAIGLWDLASGWPWMPLSGHTNPVWSVAFSPDGRTLASAGEDQTIRLWDVSSRHSLTTLYGHTNPVWSVAFSPDGHTMVSGSEDQIVRLWEVNSGNCILALEGHTHRVRSVAVSPDGTLLASGGEDQTVRLWEISSKSCIAAFDEHANRVRSVAFSPDGRLLASGSEDQTIRLWDISNKNCIRVLREHTNPVWSVAFSPDGGILASSSDDKTIRLWDLSSGRVMKVLHGHTNRIWSIAFSPNSQRLVSGSDDQTIRLWDINSGQCLHVLQAANRVMSVVFSPDGRILASGSDDQAVRLWDATTLESLNTLKEHTNWVMSVAFSSNEPIFASGSKDGTIRLWDATTHTCLRTLTSDLPYQGMNITGAIGLTQAQRDSLKALGAIERAVAG